MEGQGKEQKNGVGEEGGDEEGRRGYPLSASDYRIMEELGRGASCTVYSALCLPYNELVAIKVLQLDEGTRISVLMFSVVQFYEAFEVAYCDSCYSF